eukprot:110770_1
MSFVPGWTSLFLSIFGILCIFPPLLHLIISDKTSKISFKQIDTASSLLSLFFYLSYSIHLTTSSVYGLLYSHTNHFSSNACIGNWYAGFWLSSARFFTLLFFVSRLYKTFDGSVFALSRKRFLISIIAYLICTILASICMALQTLRPMYAILFEPQTPLIQSIQSYEQCAILLDVFWVTESRRLFQFIAIGLWTVTDVVANIALLRSFLRKVFGLSSACHEIDSIIKLQSKSVNSKNRQITKENALFLNLAVKTTMIVILMVISYFGAIIIQGMRLDKAWLTLTNITHSWCIYMTYKCGKKMYNCICFGGDVCFEWWKRCCFCCCCEVKELPQELRVNIHMDLESPVTEDKTPRVPRLRGKNSAQNESLFLDDACSNQAQPKQIPVLNRLSTFSLSNVTVVTPTEDNPSATNNHEIV